MGLRSCIPRPALAQPPSRLFEEFPVSCSLVPRRRSNHGFRTLHGLKYRSLFSSAVHPSCKTLTFGIEATHFFSDAGPKLCRAFRIAAKFCDRITGQV